MLNKGLTTIVKLTLHSLKTQILNRDILTKKCQTQLKKKLHPTLGQQGSLKPLKFSEAFP